MLEIYAISALKDNYIWLLKNFANNHCAVIDPGCANTVLQYLSNHQLTLDTILITHHHHDHIGGVAKLVAAYPNVNIISPEFETSLPITLYVKHGDKITIFDEDFLVLDLAGHTSEHIGYASYDKLFCGDVLFSMGCGRIFTGTYLQMYNSLQRILTLAPDTKIYCAHEYSASNLAFALRVDPDNLHLQKYRDHINKLIAKQVPTIPTTLKTEKLINPFLRLTQQAIINAVANNIKNTDPLSVFISLRQWKDKF